MGKLEIPITPRESKLEDGQKIGVIGVYSPIEKSALQSIKYGSTETYFWTKEIFVSCLENLYTGQFTLDALSGPVGIYEATDTVAQIRNLLLNEMGRYVKHQPWNYEFTPDSGIDGGRLLFFAVEAVRGKPIDRQKEGMVHFIGFALLMLLMLVVTWNDIQRFFL